MPLHLHRLILHRDLPNLEAVCLQLLLIGQECVVYGKTADCLYSFKRQDLWLVPFYVLPQWIVFTHVSSFPLVFRNRSVRMQCPSDALVAFHFIAHIAGDTVGRPKITVLPSGDQARFTNKRSGYREHVAGILVQNLLHVLLTP